LTANKYGITAIFGSFGIGRRFNAYFRWQLRLVLRGMLCAEGDMTESNDTSHEKIITFQFRGGSRDGQAVRSDESREGVNEAAVFWAMTRKGTTGKRFDAPIPHRPAGPHRYKVVRTMEVAGEIVVSCEAVDAAGEAGRRSIS
jgi:hypothetical protein